MSDDRKGARERETLAPPSGDEVLEPDHYKWIAGIECKDVVRHFPFLLGNAIKYIWRSGRKGDKLKDLRKARECLDVEIRTLEGKDVDKCVCPSNHPRCVVANQWVCTTCGKPEP